MTTGMIVACIKMKDIICMTKFSSIVMNLSATTAPTLEDMIGLLPEQKIQNVSLVINQHLMGLELWFS